MAAERCAPAEKPRTPTRLGSHGSLCVLKRRGGFWIRSGVGHAILDQDAVDSHAGEPVADLAALKVDRQDVVTAAWKDDDCRAGVLALGGIDGERGLRDISEAHQRAAGDEVVFGRGDVNFGSGGVAVAGRAVGPEFKCQEAGSRLPCRFLRLQCDCSSHEKAHHHGKYDFPRITHPKSP